LRLIKRRRRGKEEFNRKLSLALFQSKHIVSGGGVGPKQSAGGKRGAF